MVSKHVAWQRRQLVWQHNGLLGTAALTLQGMRTIQIRPTTTDESRALAQRIEGLTILLAESLKTRRPEST